MVPKRPLKKNPLLSSFQGAIENGWATTRHSQVRRTKVLSEVIGNKRWANCKAGGEDRIVILLRLSELVGDDDSGIDYHTPDKEFASDS
jgi:hypothetical protein